MHVRVPASSANLGPGFDALGMALDLHAEVGTMAAGPVPRRAIVEGDGHPAVVAFRAGGGTGELWVRSPIPSGRGLGFSGAMRIGGLVAAFAQRGFDVTDAATRTEILAIAERLEGHADNVAASLHGGVVATAGGRVVDVPLALDPVVLAWVPPSTTSTDVSRGRLPASVSYADAAFNVGRTALLVAALAAGDVAALRTATEDRLHQEVRFAAAPGSRDALEAGLAAGAWCGWLSGSGPTVALLCATDDASPVAAALPAGADVKHLIIDRAGAVVEPVSAVRR